MKNDKTGFIQKTKFTLIELMIVIAIIAILLTLLIPCLQHARNKSLNALCLSNIRQLGVSHYSFAKNNNGKPVGISTAGHYWEMDNFGEPKENHWWLGRERPLNEYMAHNYKNGDTIPIAECPVGTTLYNSYGTSYITNIGYFQGAWGDRQPSRHNRFARVFLSDIEDPSRMVLVEEMQAYWRVMSRTTMEEFYKSHFGNKAKLNISLTDGSAKTQVNVNYGDKDETTHTFTDNLQ